MKIGPKGQLPFKQMLGSAAAMGFALADLKKWSLWEYHAVVAGWNDANAAEDDKPAAPDISTLRAAKARHAAEMAAAAAALSQEAAA